MSNNWEISKMSAPDRIFSKIRDLQDDGLTAIVVIGADYEHKDNVYRALDKRLLGVNTTRLPTLNELKRVSPIRQSIATGHHQLILLSGRFSARHKSRHKFVNMLYDAGVKHVVLVYAKREYNGKMGQLALADMDQPAKQLMALAANPPTPDGIDYLITVKGD